MSLKEDVLSTVFFEFLTDLDPEIKKPSSIKSILNVLKGSSDKSKKNYDPINNMLSDQLRNAVFFAESSSGDMFGVYTYECNEFIVILRINQ